MGIVSYIISSSLRILSPCIGFPSISCLLTFSPRYRKFTWQTFPLEVFTIIRLLLQQANRVILAELSLTVMKLCYGMTMIGCHISYQPSMKSKI